MQRTFPSPKNAPSPAKMPEIFGTHNDRHGNNSSAHTKNDCHGNTRAATRIRLSDLSPSADPCVNHGDRGTRTPDLRVANASLSQLSYIPGRGSDKIVSYFQFHNKHYSTFLKKYNLKFYFFMFFFLDTGSVMLRARQQSIVSAKRFLNTCPMSEQKENPLFREKADN